MKLYLTLQENDLYQDDPDVLELVDKVVEKICAHTHIKKLLKSIKVKWKVQVKIVIVV